MIPVFRFRRFHRLVAVVIGLQLLLWTASGIYFAWTDLDEIHGDHLRNEPEPIPFQPGWVSPDAIDFAGGGLIRPRQLRSIEAVEILDRVYYRLRWIDDEQTRQTLLADVSTGSIRGELDREEAIALARAAFKPEAKVARVRRLEESDVGPGHEYRDGPLPAWQISFDHGSRAHVYVAAREGQVVTLRTRSWRIFDFLWMLHTMDYRGRDDINNPLLRALSAFGLLVVLSGYLLWAKTRRNRKHRGSRP